ncbi:hypothetical protein [Microbulbifer halophilus]
MAGMITLLGAGEWVAIPLGAPSASSAPGRSAGLERYGTAD